MRCLHLAAAPCLLLIAAIAWAQQPADSNRLLASSAPHVSSPADAAVLAVLFDPVSLPSDPAPVCPVPATSASSESGATMPVIAAKASSLPSAPEPAAALPDSSAEPALAFARPVSPARQPDSLKRVFFANSVMYGATVFHAFGRAAEVEACKRESGFKNGVFLRGAYKGQPAPTLSKFYAITLPIDAGVSMLSLLARHKGWHAFEIAAPLSAATAHVTAGAFKFSAGCY